MSVEILHGDCMEYMRGLPDKSFDLCITSPPYNMNLRVNAKGDGYCSRQVTKELSTKYEGFDDNLPMADYQRFLSCLIEELTRVCETVFLNIQAITGNKPALFAAVGEHSEKLKETIIWDKCVSQPSIADKTLNSGFEFIFVFGGNPIARQFKTANFSRGAESNVWRIRTEKRALANHGAGFPLALPQKIMNLFARPNSTVFDPFLGSGTTAIAAHYAGLDFVGTEIDRNYYNAASQRFDDATKQFDIFGGSAA